MENTGAAPAVASPTATPEAKPGNGANGPQTPPKPTPKPGPAVQTKPGSARGGDGKFVSQDSGTKRPEEPAEPRKQPEPYRFKRKLKVDGGEEDVDLSEDDLLREVQISRAAKKRLGELNKRLKDMDAREAKIAAMEKDPVTYLQERGVDVEQAAARLLADKAKRGLMSPEEQRIAELETENRTFRERAEAEERRQAEAQEAAAQAKQWEQEEPQYLAEMERVKLPKSMHVLGFMSKVGAQLAEALGDRGATPEIVVRETNRQLSEFADHYVLGLPAEALSEKLGPERKKALQSLWLQQWRDKQGALEPTPREEAAPPPRTEERKEPLSEADLRRRMQERWG